MQHVPLPTVNPEPQVSLLQNFTDISETPQDRRVVLVVFRACEALQKSGFARVRGLWLGVWKGHLNAKSLKPRPSTGLEQATYESLSE